MLSFKTDPTALHLHSPHHSSLPPSAFKKKPPSRYPRAAKTDKKTQRRKPLNSGTPTSFSTRHKIQESFFPESSQRHRPHKSLFLSPTHHTFARKRRICNNGKERNDGSTATAAYTEGERRTRERERHGRSREQRRRLGDAKLVLGPLEKCFSYWIHLLLRKPRVKRNAPSILYRDFWIFRPIG